MKKIYFSLLFFLLALNVFPKTFSYKVTAFNISFADAEFKEKINNKYIYLKTQVKSKKLASVFKNVDNKYFTVVDKKSFYPIFQKKQLKSSKKNYYNFFLQGENRLITENKTMTFDKKYISNLYAIFYYIKNNKPKYEVNIPSISCNTLWNVKISLLSNSDYKFKRKKRKILKYKLNFKALQSHKKMKARYNDIFLKELFWNSSEIILYIDKKKPILYKAILKSFSPNVVLTLKSVSK